MLQKTFINLLGYLKYTLSLKSLSGHSSVCYKTSLNTGGVGRAGAAPPTSNLGKFLSWPLALSMSIYSNFQINGASGETLKPPDPLFCFKKRGSGGFRSIYLEIAINRHT